MPYSDFDDSTIKFIGDHFQIRECYKYKEEKDGRCVCKKEQNEHEEMSNENEPWTHANNTILKPCDAFGYIKFKNNSWTSYRPTFIRFDPSEANTETYESIYTLLTSNKNGKLMKPNLIISIIAGTQETKFVLKSQKRNFYQGLKNVIKKNLTWVIGNGDTRGSHELISQIVSKVYPNVLKEKTVFLLGIASWGNIPNFEKLNSPVYVKNKEESSLSEDQKFEKRKINKHYNTYLFCDCEPKNQYNEEIDFRLDFQNYIKNKTEGLLVQILISGEREDIKTICKALEKKVSHVIIKGSGQIADIISEIVEIPIDDYDGIVDKVLSKYERLFKIPNGKYRKEEIDEDKIYLQQMHKEYREHIVIYDMMDTSAMFDKKIIEAIIIGSKKEIKETLELCLRFNCPEIAERFVSFQPKFKNIDKEFLDKFFMESLKDNQYTFVELFIENDFIVDDLLNIKTLKELYKITRNPGKCECADLIKSMSRNKNSCRGNKKTKDPFKINTVVSNLSGKILHKISKSYSMDQEELSNVDYYKWNLFLWALLSGRTNLAQVIWKITPNPVRSALMASYILKNMANLILAGRDQRIQRELNDGSKKFEELAVAVLDECYNKCKMKSYQLIDKKLKTWNNLTCLDIAIYGKMLTFLNHSACQSYTTNLWRGELSPFLPIWKILLAIPFGVFVVGGLIAPKYKGKGTVNGNVKTKNQNDILLESIKDSKQKNSDLKNEKEKNLSYPQKLNLFYEAPVVKFSIYFGSYILFLIIFCYFNLVELKPLEEVKMVKEVIAEILVYIYLLAFVVDEIDQIRQLKRFTFYLYFSKSWNSVDVIAIVLFIISTIVRFTINNNNFMICRILFAICLCMFFLRSMQFYFVSESIGPKVIMIKKMFRDIWFFLCIFIIFLLCFGTLSQSIRAPNSNLNLGLISSILYYPYFQMYGELMLDDFQGYQLCNGTLCDAKKAVMIVFLGLFLLSTHILLINLLIALFGFTVTKVHTDSERLWCHIRIQLVQEFKEKQIIPPPFNIIYFPFDCVISKIRSKRKEERNEKDKRHYRMDIFENKCFEAAMVKLQVDKTIGPVKA